MRAGRAAGVVTVAATWGPFSREELTTTQPTHWLERMDDLPALVRTLG